MRVRSGLWIGAAAALAVAILFAPAPSTERGLHVADGYTQIIRHIFAARGWLWLQPADDEEGALPRVALAPDIADTPVVRRFLVSSYLGEDLASPDPGVWQIADENVLGVSPHRHAMPGPFDNRDRWRGDILFRETTDSGLWLVDADREIELPLLDDPSGDPSVLPVFAQPGLAPVAAGGSYHLVAEDGSTIGRIFQIGDRTLIAVMSDISVDVTVDGLAANPRRGRAAYQVLSPGSIIQISSDGGRSRRFRIEGDQNAISRYSPFLGRRRHSALGYLAQPVEQAMALTEIEGGEGGDDPFVTTLDRDVQAAAQSQLAQIGSDQHGEGDLRAAATVMDAMTGEVLALASFPNTTAHLSPALRATFAGRRLIEADYNLSNLPVGSSIKPVFAAAIVSAHDDLRNLRLGPGGLVAENGECAFERLLWVDVERPGRSGDLPGINEGCSSAGEIDFTNFLRQSSNRYAMALMLLAARRDPNSLNPLDPPAVSDPYYLDGDWRTVGLTSLFPVRSRTATGVLLRGLPERPGLAWTNRLNAAFEVELDDVDPDPGQAPQDRLADLRQIDFWGNGFIHNPTAVAVLSGVSPQREMLDLGSVDHVTNDYLQLILGGGASRWTTVKMAEMFSQLVTGRRVHATLSHDDYESPSPSNLSSPALEAVRAGMRAAAVDGTARSLRQLEADLQSVAGEGVEVRLFAKTGTPTIERPVRSPVNAAVNRMIARGLLSSDRPDRWRVGRRPSQVVSDRATLVEALRSDPRTRSLLESEGVEPEAAADYILRLRDGSRGVRHLLRRGLRGALTGLHADGEPDLHDGSVLGVVVALYRPGDVTPAAGLTVFVNFQDHWAPTMAGSPSLRGCGAPHLCYIRALGETEAFRRAVQSRAQALRARR